MTARSAIRTAVTLSGLLLLWQAVIWVTGVAPFMLPSPAQVAAAWWAQREVMLGHAAITAAEMGIGLLLGATIGATSAVLISASAPVRRWLLPALVVSQAIPVFALAPLLVLWLGYGMASKVAMATLIIYFPVTASFLDGLRRTNPGWLDLAQVMTAGAHPWALLWRIRIPAAIPALTSGLRVAAAVAPIGAVVGEWVGSGAGLGYAMLQANARMQTDIMFAALTTLAALALLLYFSLDHILRRITPWQEESRPNK